MKAQILSQTDRLRSAWNPHKPLAAQPFSDILRPPSSNASSIGAVDQG